MGPADPPPPAAPLAWVSGASRGIGRACARGLAAAGYDIVGICRQPQAGMDALREDVAAHGRRLHPAYFDVGAADAPEQAAALLATHGCPAALVNNAGMAQDQLFARISSADWHRLLAVNLSSFYHLTQPVSRQMMRRRRGAIVSISSVAGQRGNPGQVHYAASKAGLIGATKALALELGSRQITVNAVSPGLIATDMVAHLPQEALASQIPLGRFGTPEEVAAAVVFLCSDAARYITGQVLAVNGGLYT
jgi:3-oxoacyl-[acyl-carrier protein] reductase